MTLKELLEFQSRNRGSFLFKACQIERIRCTIGLFQSRNRGSFLFKQNPVLD